MELERGEATRLYKKHKALHGEKSVCMGSFTRRYNKLGWSMKKAINTPSEGHGGARSRKGYKEMWEAGPKHTSRQGFYTRLNSGLSIKEALNKPKYFNNKRI